MEKLTFNMGNFEIPLYKVNTVIVGTGAASLNCADRLHQMGQTDIAIVTEKIGGGTSNNTGSDKQTYYKMSVFGKEADSPYEMAKSLFDGGSMHGDIALAEAIGSAEGFYHLVSIGVPFPHNKLGGFVGYKTDHDPRQRATSAGPWTSNQMFQCLLKEVERRNIPIFDNHDCVELIVQNGKCIGILTIDKNNLHENTHGLTAFQAENVVFGVGGPGGIYKTSVYPECHTGAIGIALEAGAKAINLTESQYGLASIKFRWNVSGTYQQVIPRYISTDQNGNDEKEFLNPYFKSMGKLATDIFLKGYQWPFDPRKIPNLGSSIIDILVYIETAIKKRRVYMDFRDNPRGGDGLPSFTFDMLEPEAYQYLQKSDALFGKPIDRLVKMNSMAIDLYKKNGIDLFTEPLEIAVCAQHNNGGLLGDIWWESNVKHLFPIGEVNGSHGVYRPGGSALNSGQVGSIRAAQKIAHCYRGSTTNSDEFNQVAQKAIERIKSIIESMPVTPDGNQQQKDYRREFQERMTECGSHIRDISKVKEALKKAYEQVKKFNITPISSKEDIPYALTNRQLVLAHAAYLQAILVYLEHGGGSRGSYMVMDSKGELAHDQLDITWRYKLENESFRDKVLETELTADGTFMSSFKPRRPIPADEYWFENTWNDYLKGVVFQ